MEKHKSILDKVNFLFGIAITKKYTNEELELICSYISLHSNDMVLGKVFGYSVSEYAIATLKWINDDTTSNIFEKTISTLSRERADSIFKLVDSELYKQY